MENEDDQTRGPGVRVLVILTLKKHVEGIWITRLVQRLKESVTDFPAFRNIEIEIRTLEDWLAEGWLISEETKDADDHRIIGIVNRVSDAASPALFKACCALLAAAEESLKIPVWNGSHSYSLCGNKWRHHLLFRQAKLLAPTTMVYYTGQQKSKEKKINIDTRMFRQNASGRIEVLVKPNAGGFGAGIQKISLPSINSPHDSKRTAEITIPSSFEDDMALIQQYEIPSDGNIYRVWFLNGKVQCAVKRATNSGTETNKNKKDALSSRAEFTSGCAGGNLCKLSRPPGNSNNNISAPTTNLIPWETPEEVKQEIEKQLLPLLIDAHCGSVEFLFSSSQSSEVQQRFYFDLNLLSTLPITENMDVGHDAATGEAIWSKDFDPWLELANQIWEFYRTTEQNEK